MNHFRRAAKRRGDARRRVRSRRDRNPSSSTHGAEVRGAASRGRRGKSNARDGSSVRICVVCCPSWAARLAAHEQRQPVERRGDLDVLAAVVTRAATPVANQPYAACGADTALRLRAPGSNTGATSSSAPTRISSLSCHIAASSPKSNRVGRSTGRCSTVGRAGSVYRYGISVRRSSTAARIVAVASGAATAC